MEVEIVSFEELDREKRLERARDEERLLSGEVTPEQLQEENSIFPKNTKASFDLLGYAQRVLMKE